MSKDNSNAHLMRTWRKLLEINTTEAGECLGLSARSIEDIEQGRSRVDDVLTREGLFALIHEAAHVHECKSAAMAAVAERGRKSKKK
jgi:predicted transcriptional regulator